MFNYSVILSLEELESYQNDWAAILEKENNAIPFIEYEWFATWWEVIGHNQNVEVYMVTHKGEPIAFVPLLHNKRYGTHLFQFPSLEVSYYMEIISNEQWKETVIEFLVTELATEYNKIVFELDGLLESHSTSTAIEKLCIDKQLPYSLFRSVTPYIDCSKINIQQYIKATEKKFALRKRGNRLKSLGNMKFTEEHQLATMFDLNNRRWEKKADTSAFNDEVTRNFFNRIEGVKSRAFHTELDTLKVDGGHWVGFSYSIVCRKRCVSYRIGHDNDFNLFAPGQLVTREKVIKNYHSNYNIIDFSSGYEPYKLQWATDVDYTRKFVISTTGKRERLVRLYKSFIYHLKTLLSNQRWYMQFRRNTIGEIQYFLRKTTVKEKVSLVNEKVQKYLMKYKMDIYSLENHIAEHRDDKNFFEIQLQDIIGQKEKATLIPKLFRGFRLYSSNGQNVAFCRHDRFIREESIDYMEALPPKAVFIKDYDMKNLQAIVEMLQCEGITIFTTAHGGSYKKRSILKKLGFKKVERISKYRILKWEKVLKKAY